MDARISLKSFSGPWLRKGGQLLLACGKCQRKLRDEDDPDGLVNLKKALKKRSRQIAGEFKPRLKLIVIQTKCLKVCPKRGVAVCTQAQLAQGRGSIVRSREDVDLLVQACADDQRRLQTQRLKV